jgi:hypothetical protein
MSRATIMAMHSATSRRACRLRCDRMRSSPSLSNMPNAAATWPCGRLRNSVSAC